MDLESGNAVLFETQRTCQGFYLHLAQRVIGSLPALHETWIMRSRRLGVV
jgi:hypothetical protein